MKVTISAALILIASAPLALALPQPQPQTTIKSNVEEVLLDLVARDRKGKPIADLRPEDIVVTDNGVPQTILSFRLVKGAEAVSSNGTAMPLDPLRQIRLVTLAFEPQAAPEQRKLARAAALDLVKGSQGVNVFYSVVVIDTKLLVLQHFTKDRDALVKAIMRATEGVSAPRLSLESDALVAQLRSVLSGSVLNPYPGAVPDVDMLAVATQAAATLSGELGSRDPLTAGLALVTLDMVHMDVATQSNGSRLSLDALKALVGGLREMPGRKSILYFSAGMYLPPELDAIFRHLIASANRDNVTFYSVDTRGVQVSAQNDAAVAQLNAAVAASANTTRRADAGADQAEVLAADNAELSGRANSDLPLRDLAESTGGFLIGDSNDLRGPLRRVNEEIASYYEISYNPSIAKFDGSFRKLAVTSVRKDVVIHARKGYFALPATAAAAGFAPFELPLLKVISDGKLSEDVKYRAGAVLLQPKKDAAVVAILLEVPLHALQGTVPPAMDVHCALAALIKDSKGTVVKKISNDRSLRVTTGQHEKGNLLDKTVLNLPPGKYTLDSAVMYVESTKIGAQHDEFTIPDGGTGGVGISALMPVRSYTPDAKGLDPGDPFQVQGGSVIPTMDTVFEKVPNSAFSLFFTVYPDVSISAKPAVEIEFTKDGKNSETAPMELPAADAQGRIPYLMTIPAQAIHAGSYEIRATVTQGNSSAVSVTTIRFEE